MAGSDADIPDGFCFDFKVGSPHKVGGVTGHWVYKVETRTNLPSYRNRHMTVERRYNDFAWLSHQLVARYPGCIVPPVPDKAITGTIEKVVAGSEPTALVEYRARAMRKFLVRVGAHGQLQTADVLKEFLELPVEDFAKRTAEPLPKKDPLELPLTTRIMREVQGKKGVPSVDQQWIETSAYCAQLQSFLAALRDRFEMVIRKKREQGESSAAVGKAFLKVAEEEELRHKESSLSASLASIGRGIEHSSITFADEADVETTQIAETLTYYVGMCGSVRETVFRLQRLYAYRENMKENISKTTAKRDALPDGDQKVKLNTELQSLEEDLKATEQIVASFQKTLTDELVRFHREKAFDLKQLLSTWVELQKEYSSKHMQGWETLKPPPVSFDPE
eukprot:TRINITY_DN12090_c0_g1_i1.p1 TRINITY_DN12090_c0_g1~~TRINITY_DN12090_c0_g1_i1.p1  ORF type:complete len:405 (+),score=141.26 TRINITY_DN12090_c0_g1_i1:41-1216(+)